MVQILIDGTPRTILLGDNFALTKIVADQAAASAAAAAGSAAGVAAAVAAVTTLLADVEIPGVTDPKIITGDYGAIVGRWLTDGTFWLARSRADTLTAATAVIGTLDAGNRVNTLDPLDDYVWDIVSDYGMRLAGITRSGQLVANFSISGIATEPELLAEQDRLQAAQVDGTVRTAGWTCIPIYGESTSVGATGSPALSLSQPYANLTFTGGPKTPIGSGTASSKPMVEDDVAEAVSGAARGETPCTAMASGLVEYAAQTYGTNPANLPIFSSAPGAGGKTILALNKGAFAAGRADLDYYGRFLAHISAARTLAIAASRTFIVPCWHFFCGTNYANLGTPTTYAAWKAAALQLAIDADADIRAITGQTLPVRMMLYQTSGAFTGGTLEPIQLAQFDAAAESSLIELMPPWYGVTYSGDQVHLPAAGYRLVGRTIGPLTARYLFEGRTRSFLMVSASARGNVVRLRFNERAVIDATNIGAATASGIAIVDTVGSITVNSVAVDDTGEVVVTLANAPVGAWRARVALDYRGTGVTAGAGTTGKSSNIRAAFAHSYVSGGVTIPLYRWAPHQQITGFTLEN